MRNTSVIPPETKKRPHCWGHYSKRQKGGKSGKTLQGAALTSKTAIRKLSRTLVDGEGHSLLSAASFVSLEFAFAEPKALVTSQCDRDCRKLLLELVQLLPIGESQNGPHFFSVGLKLHIAAHSLHTAAFHLPPQDKKPSGGPEGLRKEASKKTC